MAEGIDTVVDLEDEQHSVAAFNRSRASSTQTGSNRRSVLGAIGILVTATIISQVILHWLPL